MSYRVERIPNKKYLVIEKNTGHTVYETKTEKEARQMCRSLNLGSGFDGLTPEFFVAKFPDIVQVIKKTKKALQKAPF